MSFGFSIGDFLGVIKDIHHIRRVFASAPAQFKNLHDELRNLSIIIQDVEAHLPNNERKAELEKIAKSCKEVVTDIWETIRRYQEISNKHGLKHAWKRLRWEPDDVRELRERVCSNIAPLTAINGRITLDNVLELVNYKKDEQHQMYLDWLSSASYAADQYNALRQGQPGTGRWFLECPPFQAWAETPGQTLFCPGIPGAGKTILASIVIDELDSRHGNDRDVGITYLYCSFRHRHDQIQDPESLLTSIIRQLAQGLERMPATVVWLYEKHKPKGTRPSFNELSDALNVIVGLLLSRTFIVVDALDECNESSISCIVDEIFRMQTVSKLSFLATSRSIPEIETKFYGKLVQEIRATKEDVIKYLNARLDNCPCALTRRPHLREKAITAITQSVDGMFLLAQLYLDSLISMTMPKEIMDELTRLMDKSNRYDEAYNTVMKRICDQAASQKRLAANTLLWITCAKRPLTPLELRTALAVELGDPELDQGNLPDLKDIISTCAGLVIVRSDCSGELVELAHYTMQEFFTRNWTVWFPLAHESIATTCLTYLSFDAFQGGMCFNDTEFEARLGQYPLYSYAARNWGHHARLQHVNNDLIFSFLTDTLKVDASVQALFALRVLVY